MDPLQREYKFLTKEQVEHFMNHGFVRIENCFSREKAAEWTATVWVRLGRDPNDKSTWDVERINMPKHRFEPVTSFAPKAWGAMCELLGGESRIRTEAATWNDGLIVNLGTPEYEGVFPHPKDLEGWHVDGDFFVHFLDSREQALLVVPIFTDIIKDAGGTVICPEGIPVVAKHLYDHPQGVMPRMSPVDDPDMFDGRSFYIETIKKCEEFHELTGNVGDVVLMHPLMLHTASRNSLRIPRIITNPAIGLNEPFKFDRENPEDYSLVELKTLKSLGKDRLEGWHITGERAPVIPASWKIKAKMMEEEKIRLAKLAELKQKDQVKPAGVVTAVN